MNLRLLQFVALLLLAGCGSSAPGNAQTAGGADGAANLAPTDPPFTSTPIATFDNPWAMAFLAGTNVAIVTEKPGRVWLVDTANGQKLRVAGAPRVTGALEAADRNAGELMGCSKMQAVADGVEGLP